MYNQLNRVLLASFLSVLSLNGAISVTNKTGNPVDVVVRYPQWMRSKIKEVYPNQSSNITDVNKFAQVQVLDEREQSIAEAWVNPADKTIIASSGAITIFEKDDKVQIKIQ